MSAARLWRDCPGMQLYCLLYWLLHQHGRLPSALSMPLGCSMLLCGHLCAHTCSDSAACQFFRLAMAEPYAILPACNIGPVARCARWT